jgi:hypothetical protein
MKIPVISCVFGTVPIFKSQAVVIEPHFDCYAGDMDLSGGKLIRVPLRPTG